MWLGDLQADIIQQLCRSGIWGCSQHLSVSEWTVWILRKLKGAVPTIALSSAGSIEDEHSSKASSICVCEDFEACDWHFWDSYSWFFTSNFP